MTPPFSVHLECQLLPRVTFLCQGHPARSPPALPSGRGSRAGPAPASPCVALPLARGRAERWVLGSLLEGTPLASVTVLVLVPRGKPQDPEGRGARVGEEICVRWGGSPGWGSGARGPSQHCPLQEARAAFTVGTAPRLFPMRQRTPQMGACYTHSADALKAGFLVGRAGSQRHAQAWLADPRPVTSSPESANTAPLSALAVRVLGRVLQ